MAKAHPPTRKGKTMSVSIVKDKKLLREFKIETKDKNKTLSIFHGNILEDKSDLIGISVYDRQESKGDLYNSFQQHFLNNESYSMERKLLADAENGWTGIASLSGQDILYIHFDSKEGTPLQNKNFKSILKMTFATLNSLLFEGKEIQNIALPVLFRKGISKENYTNYIHLFLYESFKFLRKNRSIETLRIYVWHMEDVNSWNQVLNDKLQISIEKGVNDLQITRLKQEIMLDLHSPVLQEVLSNFDREKAAYWLSKKETNLKQIASVADSFVNSIVNAMCKLPGISEEIKSLPPFHKVKAIKHQRLVIEWFADYMISVKTFKFYLREEIPSKLDEYHYLLQILQVLGYCRSLFLEGDKVYEK